MAGEIRAHDVGAWLGLLALFEQVGESLFHEHLKLTAFHARERAQRRPDLQISEVTLGGKFLASLWRRSSPTAPVPGPANERNSCPSIVTTKRCR